MHYDSSPTRFKDQIDAEVYFGSETTRLGEQ